LIKLRYPTLAIGVLVAFACTNDFDQFDLSGGVAARGGTGVVTGGAAGSAAAGRGGTAAIGGSAGTSTIAGRGGSSSAGRGGTGGSGGGAQAGEGGEASSSGGTGGRAGSGAAGAPGCSNQAKECGGACVPLDEPDTGCGDPNSCAPCALDHATAACDATACSIDRCASGFGDCNRQTVDGCEQALGDDVDHCGACGRTCSATGVASVECQGGGCSSSCVLGRANCTMPGNGNGNDNGCETNTLSDPTRCGGCDNDCTAQGLAVCSAALCGCGAPSQCGNGNGVDCVGGLCSCSATTCRPGERCRQSGGSRVCSCNGGAACAATEACCETPAGCVDIESSAAHCGACGRACTQGFVCSKARCECDSDADCDAGMGIIDDPGLGDAGAGGEGGAASIGPRCVSGACVCGAATCGEGQRCQRGGACG
jgi:hypothetical protein